MPGNSQKQAASAGLHDQQSNHPEHSGLLAVLQWGHTNCIPAQYKFKIRSGLHRHRRLASEWCPHTWAEIPADGGSYCLGLACLNCSWLRMAVCTFDKIAAQANRVDVNPQKMPCAANLTKPGTDRAVLGHVPAFRLFLEGASWEEGKGDDEVGLGLRFPKILGRLCHAQGYISDSKMKELHPEMCASWSSARYVPGCTGSPSKLAGR